MHKSTFVRLLFLYVAFLYVAAPPACLAQTSTSSVHCVPEQHAPVWSVVVVLAGDIVVLGASVVVVGCGQFASMQLTPSPA